jgi:hypothetical protein
MTTPDLFNPATMNPASIILSTNTIENLTNQMNYIDYIIILIFIVLIVLVYLRITKKI